MRLFSYCLTCDSGAAPNPFWELCTLAICKPRIRRVANIRSLAKVPKSGMSF
ncbi:hypothetical protein [Nostoc sp.]|uniref:Nmad2 family putative nucleotide modification protein n=1 Tax=Nostoc sp. TaxID=1180 RepID=UPI003FA5E34C